MTKTSTEAEIERVIDEAYPVYVYARQHEDEMREVFNKTLVGKLVKMETKNLFQFSFSYFAHSELYGIFPRNFWETKGDVALITEVVICGYESLVPNLDWNLRDDAEFVSDEDVAEVILRASKFMEATRQFSHSISQVYHLVKNDPSAVYYCHGSIIAMPTLNTDVYSILRLRYNNETRVD